MHSQGIDRRETGNHATLSLLQVHKTRTCDCPSSSVLMLSISTRNLDSLPDVNSLKQLLQSLAMLDAILSPEWEYRYYSFNAKWSRDGQMGSMRDGSGDEFFAFFNNAGCFLKGFVHDCSMTPYRTQPPKIWPGMLESVPEAFSSALSEPAFSMDDITFGLWRRYSDQAWSHGSIEFPEGDDPDGSEALLALLDRNPATYRQFAEEYYEIEIPLNSIQHIYKHLPLTADLVSSLNNDLSLTDLAEDINEIDYPYTHITKSTTQQ